MPSLEDFRPPVSTMFSADDNYALIDQVAQTEGVDPAILRKMVEHESGFNPKAVSPKGAQGLLQLMPGTAREMGVVDPFDPVQNLTGGAKYYKKMLDAQGGDIHRALAAYNWGPGNLSKGGEWPQETKDYVAKIGGPVSSPKPTATTPVAKVEEFNLDADDFSRFLVNREGPSTYERMNEMASKVGDVTSDTLTGSPDDPFIPSVIEAFKESVTPVQPTGELPFGLGKKPEGIMGDVLDVAYGIPEAAGSLLSGIGSFIGGQVAGLKDLPHDAESGAKAFDI